MGDHRRERGQASAELLAILPLVLAGALLVAQLALAGYALWGAAAGARAGARAEHVGRDAARVAEGAVPSWLRPEARTGPDGVRVAVQAPALLPGVPRIPIVVTTALDPAAGP